MNDFRKVKGIYQESAWIFRQNRRRIVNCRDLKDWLKGKGLLSFSKEREIGFDNFYPSFLEV